MDLEVDNEKRIQIEKVISSDDSPVGIDAKKTHIIIINKLVEIEKRLDKLEKANISNMLRLKVWLICCVSLVY